MTLRPKNRFLLHGIMTLLLMASSALSRQQSDEEIPFETIIRYDLGGSFSEADPIVTVVTNRHELKKVWKLAHTAFLIRPPLPEIDFENRILLAVFHSFTGGACKTSITNIVKTEDGLEISASQTCPGSSCGPQPANVFKPVEIVVIDRVEKSIRKKEPELIVDHEFFECNPPR